MGLHDICAHHSHPIGSWPEGIEVHIHPLFKSFKRYVFLGEHEDESVTKIKIRAKFFEEKFPTKGDVSQNSDLYELDGSISSCPVGQ